MSSNLMRINLDTNAVNPHFFQAVLSSSADLRSQIRRAVNAGGRDVANTAILNGLNFTWPSFQEQCHIVAMVEAHDGQLRVEDSVLNKLRQLKRGLMEDLLTGRVRVNVAEQEPEAMTP